MSDYYKQKALQATKYKIESIQRQSNFLKRNFWKVLGFGILMSVWAPQQALHHFGFKRKSAVEVSDFSYYDLMLITALGYTLVCFLGHFIWKRQDKKSLEKLTKRKELLEKELDLDPTFEV